MEWDFCVLVYSDCASGYAGCGSGSITTNNDHKKCSRRTYKHQK